MIEPLVFNDSQKSLFKATYAANATADQFGIFIEECQRRRLIPGNHVVFQLRNSEEYSQQLQRRVSVQKVTLITTINALRLIAERTGKFRGYGETTYYYVDPTNTDYRPTLTSVIPLGKIPHAVSIQLFREGWAQPVFAVARYDAYVQTKRDGNKDVPTRMWATRGEEQLAKCAEAAALRMVAPEECGGLYIAEEFEREATPAVDTVTCTEGANAGVTVPVIVPAPTVAPAINQAPAPVEEATLTVKISPEALAKVTAPVQPGVAVSATVVPTPATPALSLVPNSPVSRPATPPPVGRLTPPPTPPAAPKPASAPPAGHDPASLNRLPAPDAEVRESQAELAVVADAVARDKDPKPDPFANTTPPNPENETRAFPPQANPAPAVAPTGDAPATAAERTAFLARLAKIVRDKLPAGGMKKDAAESMKNYLFAASGQANLNKLTVANFTAALDLLEPATPEEAVRIVSQKK